MLTLEVDRLTKTQRFRVEKYKNDIRIVPDLSTKSNTQNPMFHPSVIAETKKRILVILAMTDGAVLLLSGGLAYILAGRTLKPIKEMVEDQNQFISDASHEFRTPLTSLKSSFEVYLREKNPSLSEAKSIMVESLSEVDKMQNLSDALLQLAQYQKPNGHTNFESVSIKELINEVVRKIKPIAVKREITIIQEVKDVEVVGNKDSLIELFVILVDNALKYSPSKSSVLIKAEKKGSMVTVSVRDKGVGIEEKDIPHIFDRFYRSDSARSKLKATGYGLGLSIAKKIVNLHHGRIYVESKQNKGSVFIVQLPKAPKGVI